MEEVFFISSFEVTIITINKKRYMMMPRLIHADQEFHHTDVVYVPSTNPSHGKNREFIPSLIYLFPTLGKPADDIDVT